MPLDEHLIPIVISFQQRLNISTSEQTVSSLFLFHFPPMAALASTFDCCAGELRPFSLVLFFREHIRRLVAIMSGIIAQISVEYQTYWGEV